MPSDWHVVWLTSGFPCLQEWVPLRSVERIAKEDAVTHLHDDFERRRRGIGRPSKVDRFREFVVQQLAGEPHLLGVELLRRARLRGYDGGKSAFYNLVKSAETRSSPLGVGKRDPFGHDRNGDEHGKPLASHSTLNRLELAPAELDPKRRDIKIQHDEDALADLLGDLFLDASLRPPTSPSMSTRRTTNYTDGRRAGSTMAITTATAICPGTSSAETTSLSPSSRRLTTTAPRTRSSS